MESNDNVRLGRRALLAAGAAGVAAAAAEALAAPTRVLAADHDPLKIGEVNSSSTDTTLNAPTSHGLVASSGGGDGLRGSSSVANRSGVFGYSTSADGFGVYGHNLASDAYGYVGGKDAGVYGFNSTAYNGAGIQGESSGGGAPGVRGDHTGDGPAVMGVNAAYNTMGGLGQGSTGVYGDAPLDSSHYGLLISGRVRLVDRSTVLTIPAGASKLTVSAHALTGGGQVPTMVLATLQTNRPGVYVQAAVPNAGAGTITIYLNKKVTSPTKVAILILD